MRLSLAAAVAAVAVLAAAAPALASPTAAAPSTGHAITRRHTSSHASHKAKSPAASTSSNPNVQAGGAVPSGAEPIDYNNAEAVKGRVKYLWTQVEKSKPVEHAAIDYEYRNFRPGEYKMLSTGINQRPYQPDFYRTTQDNVSLPSDFLWGYASASAQVEGAVKADGRGPSIWDWFAHRTDGMRNGDTFDVATNFRYMYPLDIKRVATMGAKLYSFSISWSRVMPLGRGYVSQEGLQFYKDLVTEIHKNGMKAAVTLQHWDIPLYLQIAENGLQNLTYATAFAQYANVVMKALGPMGVEHWVSHNEPQVMCNQRYLLALTGIYGYQSAPKSTRWMCTGTTIKAHGRMNELFRQHQQNGVIRRSAQLSFKNSGSINVPWNSNNKRDVAAVARETEFGLGIFCDPIHSDSHDYPDVVKREVPSDWLPALTDKDKQRLRNSGDFFATDYYASSITRSLPKSQESSCFGNPEDGSWPSCSRGNYTLHDGWPIAQEYPDETCSSWLSSTPGALRTQLQYLAKRWPTSHGIVVSEFGWAEKDEASKTAYNELVMDTGRQSYYRGYLNQIVESIRKDGINVAAAWLWSATCNVEWEVGKEPRFGVQNVNYSNPNLPRTYLGSAYLVKDFFRKHL